MSTENENGNFAKPMLPAVFVGQVLFKEVTSRYSDTYISEHTVIKVGKKYFECEGLRDKFNITNLTHEDKMYSQRNYKLYRSKQEIHDKNEFVDLMHKIQNTFSHYNHNKDFTLEQLRQIADIAGCR